MCLNGLDNIDARRHVNRMCLAASVPLVESGTAGYVGQTSVHLKGQTSCYECTPKPAPKTFAICTIRNTPEKPIHCVGETGTAQPAAGWACQPVACPPAVYAKELLFQRLFGPPEAVTDLDDAAGADGPVDASAQTPAAAEQSPSFYLRKDGEARRGETGATPAAPSPLEQSVCPAAGLTLYPRRRPQDSVAYARRIFDWEFRERIERLLANSAHETWASRQRPTPIHLRGAPGGATRVPLVPTR